MEVGRSLMSGVVVRSWFGAARLPNGLLDARSIMMAAPTPCPVMAAHATSWTCSTFGAAPLPNGLLDVHSITTPGDTPCWAMAARATSWTCYITHSWNSTQKTRALAGGPCTCPAPNSNSFAEKTRSCQTENLNSSAKPNSFAETASAYCCHMTENLNSSASPSSFAERASAYSCYTTEHLKSSAKPNSFAEKASVGFTSWSKDQKTLIAKGRAFAPRPIKTTKALLPLYSHTRETSTIRSFMAPSPGRSASLFLGFLFVSLFAIHQFFLHIRLNLRDRAHLL